MSRFFALFALLVSTSGLAAQAPTHRLYCEGVHSGIGAVIQGDITISEDNSAQGTLNLIIDGPVHFKQTIDVTGFLSIFPDLAEGTLMLEPAQHDVGLWTVSAWTGQPPTHGMAILEIPVPGDRSEIATFELLCELAALK